MMKFLILAAAIILTQDLFYVSGNIKSWDDQKLPGTYTSLWQDGQLLEIANGSKFEFDLDTGDYVICFHAPGYITKHVRMDTRGAKLGGEGFDLEIKLKERKPGLPDSLDFPIAIARYDKKTKTVDWDVDYSKAMYAKMKELIPELAD